MKKNIKEEISIFYKLKNTGAPLHTPLLASLCMGIPLLTGLYLNNLRGGLTACLAAFVILYFPLSGSFAERIITLLACSFGLLISYTIGIVFSFNFIVSSIAFGLFSMFAHWISLYLNLKPPKSFFFIMICATASCVPYNLNQIPINIGLMAIGGMVTSILALSYSLIISKNIDTKKSNVISIVFNKNISTDFLEAIIMGVFMCSCLLLGHLLNINNPYWVPVSCAAVMQGATRYHVWQRVSQRIMGTFLGLGLCWFILLLIKTPIAMCITIIILQFIIETLVTRNYTFAVIFITPVTILLTEISNPLISNANAFISIRFWNIVLGSLIGAIGGWIIYHEKIHYNTIKNIKEEN